MVISKIFKWGFNYFRLFFLKLRYGNRINIIIKQGEHPPFVSWKSKIGISGKGMLILYPGVYISPFCQVQTLDEGKIILKSNSYIGDFSRVVSKKYVEIGTNTLLANNVSVYDHDHKYSSPHLSITEAGYLCGKVIIRDNCWLATNVVVLRDTTVSSHSVVGANSVAKGNLSETGIYAGAPAVLKKKYKYV